MLEIASLGSGSAGNALLVRSGGTLLLIDCGFTLKETILRMAMLGLTPGDLDAVLISHEHGDHVRGIGPLARKFGVPVWLTHGTFQSCRDQRLPRIQLFNAHEPFCIGAIGIDPFPTPHDAAESCQFVFDVDGVRFASVTDLGACTPHVRRKLDGVHGLVVECNYDEQLLRDGPYPASLQARIRSDYGHLGNKQAGELVASLDHADLQLVLLGHLSEQNNTDEVALATMHRHLADRLERVRVLQQHRCSDWFGLGRQASPAGIRSATARGRSVEPPCEAPQETGMEQTSERRVAASTVT